MNLTREEGRQIVLEEHPDGAQITQEPVRSTSRWSKQMTAIFRHEPTQKCYELRWSRGLTEMQDEGPFDNTDPQPIEVEKKEVAVTQWVPVSA